MSSVRSFTWAAISAIAWTPLVLEVQLHVLGLQKRLVLAHQRVARLREDPHEVVALQAGELDADREAALQLGDEVRGLGHVEGTGGDEENVVGRHGAVLGLDRRALDDRQQIALHALPRDVRTLATPLARRHLVDLVDEHDARLLDPLHRQLAHLLRVDQARRPPRGRRPRGPSATFMRRRSRLLGQRRPPSRSLNWTPISSTPWGVMIERSGVARGSSLSSTSIIALVELALGGACRAASPGSREALARRRARRAGPRRAGGSSASRRRSSARSSAFDLHGAPLLLGHQVDRELVRSRMMDSTSRPRSPPP